MSKKITDYSKEELVKIAKKHEINLKTKEKKLKTKEQLYASLKRKKLV